MCTPSLRLPSIPTSDIKGENCLSVTGGKQFSSPKFILKCNNRQGRKNRNSSGEDGQVAHCVNSRSIQSSHSWMENKYSVRGSLSAEETKKNLIISNVRSLSNSAGGRRDER